jgi:hypothetical protein
MTKGNGSLDSPWDLITAGLSPSIFPGDTLNLIGGTYSGIFEIGLTGTTIKNYDTTPAVIDGEIHISNQYNTIQGLTIFNSLFTTRESEQSGSTPTDLDTDILYGLRADNKNNTIQDMIIHDTKLGIYVPDEAGPLFVIDGCIIYYNGWSAPDRTHGHGCYVMNNGDATAPLIIRNCIVFNNFGWGLHGFCEGLNYINNIQFINNISFGAGSLVAGSRATNLYLDRAAGNTFYNPIWRGNLTYNGKDPNHFSSNATMVNGILENNYMPDGIIIGSGTYTESGNIILPEETNRIFVIPVINRLHIAIYNWELLDFIVIPAIQINSLLSAYDTYQLTQVQDLYEDIITGVVEQDGSIIIDMRANSHTMATPQGWDAPNTTFPEFGCFIIEKV